VQPGAALIALSEGAPIVPVVIQGTIFKDGGDLDGQGVIVVPIRVILP